MWYALAEFIDNTTQSRENYDHKAWLMKERGLIEFHDEAVVQFLLRHDGTVIIRLPYD